MCTIVCIEQIFRVQIKITSSHSQLERCEQRALQLKNYHRALLCFADTAKSEKRSVSHSQSKQHKHSQKTSTMCSTNTFYVEISCNRSNHRSQKQRHSQIYTNRCRQPLIKTNTIAVCVYIQGTQQCKSENDPMLTTLKDIASNRKRKQIMSHSGMRPPLSIIIKSDRHRLTSC